jgi:Zn-dependent peptidase ImmA (M78 family)
MTSVLTDLRNLVPLRALNMPESYRLAELQATRLRERLGIESLALPTKALLSIPRLRVERLANVAGTASGGTGWSKGTWVIVLNDSEPENRVRYSLCHELKHVIDGHWRDTLYPPLFNLTTRQRSELIANHFAACLLMPRVLVKRLYCDEGIQDTATLARCFGVSVDAMRRRLELLGLIDKAPRCLVA